MRLSFGVEVEVRRGGRRGKTAFSNVTASPRIELIGTSD
jgi:hypothetical protein